MTRHHINPLYIAVKKSETIMRSPRNGQTPSPLPRMPTTPHFHSTVSVQKLKRFNLLILVFRFAAFCFSLAASIFMLTNNSSTASNSLHWYDFDAFRFALIADAIVATYSLVEMGASVWEISRGATLLPEIFHVWFDFGHDQAFAYLLLSANSAGTELARMLRGSETCKAVNSFCVQSDVAIALGFAGFLFLGFSSLLSGYRVVCFIVNGSRFHL